MVKQITASTHSTFKGTCILCQFVFLMEKSMFYDKITGSQRKIL